MIKREKLGAILISVFVIWGCGQGAKDISFGVETNTSGASTAGATDAASISVAANSATGASSLAVGASDTTSSNSVVTSGMGAVWSASEILSEARSGGSGRDLSCGGSGGFKHCVCPEDVPSSVRYRPAVAECGDNAAVVLDGKYSEAFSVVVRDSQNRDRWPESGFNGCSGALASSDAPPASCSVFKVQSEVSLGNGAGKIYCLGASGYSSLFSDVERITIKLGDDPNSSSDPIERFCISDPTLPLN